MLRFALDGIFSFSILPLRLATWTGFAASALAISESSFILLERFIGVAGLVKGWSSAVIAELFIGGVQLICLGIIGEYVGRKFTGKRRGAHSTSCGKEWALTSTFVKASAGVRPRIAAREPLRFVAR